jgi:hypothetical protein
VQLLDGRWGDAEIVGNFGKAELTQALLGIRGILFLTEHVEPVRNQFSLLKNDFIEGQFRVVLNLIGVFHLPPHNIAFSAFFAFEALFTPKDNSKQLFSLGDVFRKQGCAVKRQAMVFGT